jgi:TRAP-type C4-dicarboxylate transport system substrate-binding protein
MDKDVWNQISKEDQKLIKKIGAEMSQKFLADYKDENIRVNETFIKKGIKFNELSAADRESWYKLAGPPIEKAWLAEMDKRGQGDNARDLLKRYRALIAGMSRRRNIGLFSQMSRQIRLRRWLGPMLRHLN